MTSPASAYLKKARQALREARAVADIELVEAAGRATYLAVFHAAQAFVVARTGKIAKTHSGLRSEFARNAKEETRIDRRFPAFLAQAYNLKTIADYEISPDAPIDLAELDEAMTTATQFVDVIALLINEEPSTDR